MYQDPRFGSEPRYLDMKGQSPTALHSWGSALRPCPCKCRSSGFSLQTLEQRGLRGVGVFSQVLQDFRFPHPAEVGFLNTVPLDFVHLEDTRAALCLVGQVAAPLRALWVYAQVRQWAELTFTGSSQVDPSKLVQAFKQKLLQSRQDLRRAPSLEVPGLLWLCRDGVTYTVGLTKSTKVQELVAAELALIGPGFKVFVLEGERRLPPHAFLHHNNSAKPYTILAHEKKARARLDTRLSAPTPATCSESHPAAAWACLM